LTTDAIDSNKQSSDDSDSDKPRELVITDSSSDPGDYDLISSGRKAGNSSKESSDVAIDWETSSGSTKSAEMESDAIQVESTLNDFDPDAVGRVKSAEHRTLTDSSQEDERETLLRLLEQTPDVMPDDTDSTNGTNSSIKSCVAPIQARHLAAALRQVKPSLDEAQRAFYEEIARVMKGGRAKPRPPLRTVQV